MRKVIRAIAFLVTLAAGFDAGMSEARAAAAYAPTSFEIVYQPVYSMATGGPSEQLAAGGGGLRLGFEMAPMIGFELGGFLDPYAFGGVPGLGGGSTYAARATAGFALAPHPSLRLTLGADANWFFNPPAEFIPTGEKDFGIVGGARILIGGLAKFFVGAEYRYPLAAIFTYNGNAVRNTAVLGTIGLHFGGF